MTYLKSLFQKKYSITNKQNTEDTKEYKPNWLMDYYIPSGGLSCLKTSAHDKGFVWSRQLANDLVHNSPDSFCDEPLRNWGNCLFWDNYFQINFTEASYPDGAYTCQNIYRIGSTIHDSFEELQQQIKKWQPVLLTITDLPLFLSAKTGYGEPDILAGLARLRTLALNTHTAILGICPNHTTPLLGMAASCCESLSDTVLSLDVLSDSGYLYKQSLLKMPPFGYNPIPAYLYYSEPFLEFESLGIDHRLPNGYTGTYGMGSVTERKALAKELRENGEDITHIAKMFGVHESTIYKWTNEPTKADNGFPFTEGTGRNVRYFKGKVIFDGKFH